jgi:hypothetical protein
MPRPISAMLAAAIALAALAPVPAAAQLFFYNPDFKAGPVEASDPIVGEPLPGATPAEQRAALLWNFRAAMNVSALQCQSPYMRATANYNGFIAHHATELAAAYAALGKYFVRVNGPKGANLFDQYSTRTYNSFSTMNIQGFCQASTNTLKSGLRVPKGELAPFALAHIREVRSSLAPAFDKPLAYNPYVVQVPQLPNLGEDCWNKANELTARCGGAGGEDTGKKRRG